MFQAGLSPFLVVATAGTTDCGSVDPLDDVADVATKHSIWFHVDAAYGGAFLLSEEKRKMLKGNADSNLRAGIILNYEKGILVWGYTIEQVQGANKPTLLNYHIYLFRFKLVVTSAHMSTGYCLSL